MTTSKINTLIVELFNADARCIVAVRALEAHERREGIVGGNWAETEEEARADEARWAIEQRALASGDPALITIVAKRRERDGVGMACAA